MLGLLREGDEVSWLTEDGETNHGIVVSVSDDGCWATVEIALAQWGHYQSHELPVGIIELLD